MRLGQRAVLALVAAAAMSISLLSCQPPAPQILAVLEGGRVLLHIRDRGLLTDRIFGWSDEKYDIAHLRVERGPETTWYLVPDSSSPNAAACTGEVTFPVVYGASRCGYRSATGPTPLRPGGRYRVRLGTEDSGGEWWSGSVLGLFVVRADGSIDNLRTY